MVPALGIPAFCLRLMLYHIAVDERGLIQRMHPLTIVLYLLALTAALVCAVTVWSMKGSKCYDDNFRRSIPGALGSWLLALGILAASVLGMDSFDAPGFGTAHTVLGFVSAISLAYCGICRLTNHKPVFLAYLAAALFFAVHLLMCYRTWSSDPQMMNFIFALGAAICLMLCCYYHTAFCVDLGSRRGLLFAGVFGTFCAMAAAAAGDDVLLWLTGAAWMITDLCVFSPVQTSGQEKV